MTFFVAPSSPSWALMLSRRYLPTTAYCPGSTWEKKKKTTNELNGISDILRKLAHKRRALRKNFVSAAAIEKLMCIAPQHDFLKR